MGAYPSGASPYGVMDMAGNVWEWVNDRYSVDYSIGSPTTDPPGPPMGIYRAVRGGSWDIGLCDGRSAGIPPRASGLSSRNDAGLVGSIQSQRHPRWRRLECADGLA